MRKADILKLPSMPMAGPSYPAGPYRFINREFLVITYETDPAALRGALPEPLLAMPARATFSYKKRKGRREYVRVALRAAAAGVVEVVKYEQDGAGVLTSLTETDGLAELGEDVTNIEPGATVGFLSYASLVG